MDKQTLQLFNDINRSIIQFRGLYSIWSNEHGISYNEMLVLYTIREKGFCTQKQVCDNYLLPRQTINNVISRLRGEGILEISQADSSGREKAFVLTEKGEAYARPLLDAMNRFEDRAFEVIGKDKLFALTELMTEYDQALTQALTDAR